LILQHVDSAMADLQLTSTASQLELRKDPRPACRHSEPAEELEREDGGELMKRRKQGRI
jgi:hypothetical protein